MYAYAGQNPLAFIDPLGEFGIVGGVLGGSINLASQLLRNGSECVDWSQVGMAALGGALTGGFGGVALKKLVPSYIKNNLTRPQKGNLGEALSRIKYALKPGWRRVAGKDRRIPGERAYPDHVYDTPNGRVYVESKLGTSKLTYPQKLAQKNLGPSRYLVDYWTYPVLGNIGGVSGEVIGGIGAGGISVASGSPADCECK